MMKEIDYDFIITPELIAGAILHTHEPFVKDYLVLHALIKNYKNYIRRFLEIGTNLGEGTKIIVNALGDGKLVYTLDLPSELAHLSKQHPISEGKKEGVGSRCDLRHCQLTGDSMTYDYGSLHDVDAWFIDGEHDYAHPRHETKEAVKMGAKLIVWHDADMQEVHNAIVDSFEWNEEYSLYRVTGTRIAYALKNNL